MFRIPIISLVALWVICVFAYFAFVGTPSANDEIAYQNLMGFSDHTKELQVQQEERPTRQTRHQISKQILYKKDCNRMQSRLYSEQSELVYDRLDGKRELIEHFNGLVCTMQEKLINVSKNKDGLEISSFECPPTKQYFRHLNASQAIYSYKSGQLEAEGVEVAHYLIPGDQWPFSFHSFHPLMQGEAQKIQLLLFKEPSLKAQGFQAAFYDREDEGT